MSVDLVWLVRRGPNEPLRYSLRSLTENIEHRGVHVIGNPPSWFTGHMVRPRMRPGKYGNTRISMRMACDDPQISAQFVYCNDDFFLFKSAQVPVLNRGPLAKTIEQFKASRTECDWARGATETLELLRAEGIDSPLNFEMHVPLVIDKAVMRRALQIIDASTARVPYMRTLYGNLAGLKGRTVKDPKVFTAKEPVPRGPWMSTDNRSWPGVAGEHVRATFPTPSIYELSGSGR